MTRLNGSLKTCATDDFNPYGAQEAQGRLRVGLYRCRGNTWSNVSLPKPQRPSPETHLLADTVVSCGRRLGKYRTFSDVKTAPEKVETSTFAGWNVVYYS